MINKIDFTKISDSSKVIELLKKREKIEKEIREIDEMALVKYELQALNIDDENNVIVDKVKESVEEEYENFYCSEYEDGEWKCETQCLGCAGLQNQVKDDLNNESSVIKNPNCDCDKSKDGYCTNLLCQNFYPQ